LGALGVLGVLGTLRAVRALRALGTLGTLGVLGALRTLGVLGALGRRGAVLGCGIQPDQSWRVVIVVVRLSEQGVASCSAPVVQGLDGVAQ
jgi:hypothetical protein